MIAQLGGTNSDFRNRKKEERENREKGKEKREMPSPAERIFKTEFDPSACRGVKVPLLVTIWHEIKVVRSHVACEGGRKYITASSGGRPMCVSST